MAVFEHDPVPDRPRNGDIAYYSDNFLTDETTERNIYHMDLKELNYVVTVANEGTIPA